MKAAAFQFLREFRRVRCLKLITLGMRGLVYSHLHTTQTECGEFRVVVVKQE